MEQEAGDEYIRKFAAVIRAHEQRLAEFGAQRRSKAGLQSGFPNMLGWIGLDYSATPNQRPTAKPTILSTDLHHLFYLLMRLEGLGIDIGTLDVKLTNSSRPTSYVSMLAAKDRDRSDTLSISSFRSSLSAVSMLSLGGGWWGRAEPPKVDLELKYIYSSFTKLPALSIHQNSLKVIAELMDDPPTDNAVPMHSFKSLQSLEILDIDPRALLGWDRLAQSLRSLTIKRSGVEDVADILIDAVVDDQAQREGNGSSTVGHRRKQLFRFNSSRSRLHALRPGFPPSPVMEGNELPDEEGETTNSDTSPVSPEPPLSPDKWRLLRHLSLADNALTFVPSTPFTFLISLTHLDLSSNLLVSVPPGLSALYNLISLNLSDNMIDSVLGIYTQLGQVLTVNLAKNRLESLCGLERLVALERVDLRENRVDDSGEVGRLAVLPHIAEIWIEGNPFARPDGDYRVKCFNFFAEEGKSILLDGSEPTFIEARNIATTPTNVRQSRPTSSTSSPPVVAVGGGSSANGHGSLQTPPASPGLIGRSPESVPVHKPPPRKRVQKRIVDLNGDGPMVSQHRRGSSDSAAMFATPRDQGATITQKATSMEGLASGSEVVPIQPSIPERPRRSRHARYSTEGMQSSSSTPFDAAPLTLKQQKQKPRSAERRLSATSYDPDLSIPSPLGTNGTVNDGDAYRARIEALRNEVGDGWLKVLSQSGGFAADERRSTGDENGQTTAG